MRRPVPVILDTDIGGDIDDTWALGQLLRSPELDLRLVTVGTGDPAYRAQLVARILREHGDPSVGIGLGIATPDRPGRATQGPWVAEHPLSAYPGPIHEDGIEALVRMVMDSVDPLTVLGIGPLPNIAAALEREPRVAERCRFVGMLGSIRYEHEGRPGAIPEFNVVRDIAAAQRVLTAPWREIVLTPLDSCGVVRLDQQEYAELRASTDPLAQAIVENYRLWLHGQPDERSSLLYDTVAIHLGHSEQWLEMEDLRILVDDEGRTLIDPRGQPMRIATGWTDLTAFKRLLVDRLTGRAAGRSAPAAPQ